MENKFTITVHDVNGVRQFNLHQIIKRIAIYGVMFLLVLSVVGAISIVFLNSSLLEIEAKKAGVESAMVELKSRNASLRRSITSAEKVLEEKKEELSVVADRLDEIETLIGLVPQQDVSLAERIEIAQLTSEQMATLFKHIPNGSPVEYKGVTSKFGYRIHPMLKKREYHRGADLRAAMKTPVYATADAVVEYGGLHKESGYGNLVILDHNYGFKTFFGHLKKIMVKSGQFVKKGDLIAYSGNSGMSSGPHLHYEVRFIQRTLNPLRFIKWDVANYSEIFKKENQVPWQSLIAAMTKPGQEATPPTAAQQSSWKVLLSRAK